jgi:cupin 2 domain-containing protein
VTEPSWRRGRLPADGNDPATGERFAVLYEGGGVVIEHIASSASVAPQEYDQDHDEWVVVLAGGATLTVGDTDVDLHAGEWVLLPRHVRHSVRRTAPGTRWLAVHLPAPPTTG